MTIQKLVSIIALFAFPVLYAQQDTVMQLKEVVITDTQLRDLSHTQKVIAITDSVILRSPASITSLLAFNTPMYFKENGYGMVSSPSFRGTTASQTAVVWNGINVNSQLNGQTDFGATTARGFDGISVRAGGGSVIYGSSAIGGSIHLNSGLQFGNHFDNILLAEYGSFNTVGGLYKMSAGNDRLAASAAIIRNSSDNDYRYPGYDLTNTNGQYYNTSANTAFGYKLDGRNIIRLYSYWYNGERHFSGTLVAPSRDKYQDDVVRNMAEWLGAYGKFTSKLKLAALHEKYRYYRDVQLDSHTYGNVNSYIARYDARYSFSEKFFVNAIADYTANKGTGSDILPKTREIISGALLAGHKLTDKLGYEAGLRAESTAAYRSPLLYSAGLWYTPARWYKLRVNGSRNFRMPTYNDLYWQTGGNPNLKAENSLQGEIGNDFTFNNFSLTLNAYYMDIRDMIRWVPQGTLWSPVNTDRVRSYGLEAIGNFNHKFGDNQISANGTYAYTLSKDHNTGLQLMYVPVHKATASVTYQYKRAMVYVRHLFTGEVFTTTDESARLKPYNVTEAGAEYNFAFAKGLTIGLRGGNIFNTAYQNVAQRPMPGRNITAYLNFKF